MGFLDEVWWSRFAQPAMQAWAPSGRPFRLAQRDSEADDEAPKALACYGVYTPVNAIKEPIAQETA